MSELDDLRTENKELKRLLVNALELLEKSKRALTKRAQSAADAGKRNVVPARRAAKVARKPAPRKRG